MFLKPTTSYLASGGNMEIPKGVVAHHEGWWERIVAALVY